MYTSPQMLRIEQRDPDVRPTVHDQVDHHHLEGRHQTSTIRMARIGWW